MKVPSLYKDGNTLGIHYSGDALAVDAGGQVECSLPFFGCWSQPGLNGEPVVSSGTGRVGDMW